MAVGVGGLNVRLVLWFTAENIRCRPDSQTGMHQDPLGPPAPPTSWRISFLDSIHPSLFPSLLYQPPHVGFFHAKRPQTYAQNIRDIGSPF